MTNEIMNRGFWSGLLSGFIMSILTAIITIWAQHSYTVKEKTVQLYLDEKNDFVLACDEYLRQYRHWHELMNYLTFKDSLQNSSTAEFQNFEEALVAYRNWKKEIDFAHGKIFMLSSNEFGYLTLEVSTILHGSLADLLENDYDTSVKRNLLTKIDGYFFERWLIKAQEEIFSFNSGNRKQKSLPEFLEEQQRIYQDKLVNDSIDDQLHQNLMKLYDYQLK